MEVLNSGTCVPREILVGGVTSRKLLTGRGSPGHSREDTAILSSVRGLEIA